MQVRLVVVCTTFTSSFIANFIVLCSTTWFMVVSLSLHVYITMKKASIASMGGVYLAYRPTVSCRFLAVAWVEVFLQRVIIVKN